MEDYKNILEESLTEIFKSTIQLLPKLVLTIIGLIVAWILVRLVLFILKRVLRAAKIDQLTERLEHSKLFGDKPMKIDIGKIILTVTKVLLILFFAIILSEVMGLKAISDGIISIFAYLPILFSALLILVGGFYLALVVKKAVLALFTSMGIGGSKAISNTFFYLIAFFVSITALNQAGIDTEIITSNFTLVLGAFLLAIAIGFGLGSKEVFTDVLKMFYARRTYMVGDTITIDNLEGTIEAIDNISLTIVTAEGKVIVPIKEVVAKRVVLKSR
ncbi:MAG: mechanosensitive ion channel domain-containing protein [Bacteroidota bacterium]